jgi:hypothetical protein
MKPTFVAPCLAINDAGQIVGTNFSTQRGFLFADGVFTIIPGTNPIGINNVGQILEFPNSSAPGVLVTNGVSMTLPNVPNTAFTHYTGLNDAGALVGFYETPDGSTELGFLYENGLFATVSFPGSFGTRAFGINDAPDCRNVLPERTVWLRGWLPGFERRLHDYRCTWDRKQYRLGNQ